MQISKRMFFDLHARLADFDVGITKVAMLSHIETVYFGLDGGECIAPSMDDQPGAREYIFDTLLRLGAIAEDEGELYTRSELTDEAWQAYPMLREGEASSEPEDDGFSIIEVAPAAGVMQRVTRAINQLDRMYLSTGDQLVDELMPLLAGDTPSRIKMTLKNIPRYDKYLRCLTVAIKHEKGKPTLYKFGPLSLKNSKNPLNSSSNSSSI